MILRAIGAESEAVLSRVWAVRRASELERAIVEPGGDLRPQNRTVRVVTRDGTTARGRLLNHDTFTQLRLDSQEQLRSFLKSSLREVTFIKTISRLFPEAAII